MPETKVLPKEWQGRPYVFGKHISMLMNPKTKEPFVTFIIAKQNCKHCYGRGFIGLASDGTPLPCSCLVRNIQKYNAQNHYTINNVELVYQKPKGKSK